MIDWTDNLELDLSIDNVKEQQPDFLKIDWDNPQIFENEKRYLILKIKGNNDPLGMNNFLVFIENKYQGRFAHK